MRAVISLCSAPDSLRQQLITQSAGGAERPEPASEGELTMRSQSSEKKWQPSDPDHKVFTLAEKNCYCYLKQWQSRAVWGAGVEKIEGAPAACGGAPV